MKKAGTLYHKVELSNHGIPKVRVNDSNGSLPNIEEGEGASSDSFLPPAKPTEETVENQIVSCTLQCLGNYVT